MIDTLANLATIVGAIPVTIAAALFLFKTLPTYFTAPHSLHLEVTPAVGDPGYFVRVTNYGQTERHIDYVGVMPADLLPWWARTTRRVSSKKNSIESLNTHTIAEKVDFALSSGKSISLLIPQPIESQKTSSESSTKRYRTLVERDTKWRRNHDGRTRNTPYVRLATGKMSLGKGVRLQRELQCLAMMLCRCGHSPTQHRFSERPRLAAKMSFLSGCDVRECRCRRYKETGERTPDL